MERERTKRRIIFLKNIMKLLLIQLNAYNSNGNKGIAAGLGNVQKLRDGQPLGSRANAKDEFEAVDAEDDFLS